MAKKKSSPKKKACSKKSCPRKCPKKCDTKDKVQDNSVIDNIPIIPQPQSKTNRFFEMMKKAFGYE